MMEGTIFTADTFRFFRELARNNRKEWMDANRERYQQHVVRPFRALLEALTPVALTIDPNFDLSGRTGTNFSRINRDIRFAKDKSPYRPQMYLQFSGRGSKGNGGQLYVGASGDSVTVGFRIYGSGRESALARRVVPRILKDLQWVTRQQKSLGKQFESYWYSTEKGEWTKHEGFPLRAEDWKRLQGWVVRKKLNPAAALRTNFVAEAGKLLKKLAPLYHFTSGPGGN